MRFSPFAAAALIALTPATAFAWNDGGHEIVAAIAYARLNPKARAAVDRLLAVPVMPAGRAEPADPAKRFMHAAHWADDVRSQLPEASIEHYIDQPIPSDTTPLPEDLPGADNVVVALKKHVRTLQSGSDDAASARALRFVIHFVGDIHQPLHGGTRISKALPEGDKGGNLFMVQVPDASGALHPMKLHAYWDGGLDTFPKTGEQFAPPPDEEIPPAMAVVLNGHPDSDPEIPLGGPFAFQWWADESKEMARESAYGHLKPDDQPPAAYQKRALEIAHRRVAWAGYRLATLLNAIWPE